MVHGRIPVHNWESSTVFHQAALVHLEGGEFDWNQDTLETVKIGGLNARLFS
jgi:hypothetical protein